MSSDGIVNRNQHQLLHASKCLFDHIDFLSDDKTLSVCTWPYNVWEKSGDSNQTAKWKSQH